MARLDRRLLDTIYPADQYSAYVYRMVENNDRADAAIKSAAKWCDENSAELEEIYTNSEPTALEHPFKTDDVGNPIQLSMVEWAMSKFFVWEYNKMAEAITDTMFSDIDKEIEDLINQIS